MCGPDRRSDSPGLPSPREAGTAAANGRLFCDEREEGLLYETAKIRTVLLRSSFGVQERRIRQGYRGSHSSTIFPVMRLHQSVMHLHQVVLKNSVARDSLSSSGEAGTKRSQE